MECQLSKGSRLASVPKTRVVTVTSNYFPSCGGAVDSTALFIRVFQYPSSLTHLQPRQNEMILLLCKWMPSVLTLFCSKMPFTL